MRTGIASPDIVIVQNNFAPYFASEKDVANESSWADAQNTFYRPTETCERSMSVQNCYALGLVEKPNTLSKTIDETILQTNRHNG